MALSFIGKPISLISQSDVRYRGILAGIDPAASTIQLSNVFSMGTESRRSAEEYIPPVQEPYAFIIFRASEVKDLAVDEMAPAPIPRQRSVHDDPAVIGVSAPAPQPQFNAYAQQQQQPQPPQQPQQSRPPQQGQGGQQPRQQGQRPNPVHSASESLETVQRAIGEMRISHHNGQHQPPHPPQHQPHHGGGGGGHHGRRNQQQPREIKVPNSDFDFESSNAKFEKKRTEEEEAAAAAAVVDEENGPGNAQPKEKEKPAYDPAKSFFDSLTSGTPARTTPGNIQGGGSGGGGGGGKRGGGGRNRREEERERNVATFGEPGGVGLMGPGAYVGGWGGYGRRGGRPRRGGGRGNGPPQAVGGRS